MSAEKPLKTFTVVGIYSDNNQRWAQSFAAEDAEDAERQVKELEPEILIAGVIAGKVEMIA